MLINLVPRVPSFCIRTKFRLKNRVTTVYLLQCKTNFFIYLCFWERNLLQIKKHLSWEASINIKKKLFWFVYTCLHSSALVYICLDSSSDSSTLAYIRLHSSTFVYTRLHLSSDSPVFLEQIMFLLQIITKFNKSKVTVKGKDSHRPAKNYSIR